MYNLISPFATLRVMKLSFRSYTLVTDFRYGERRVSGAMIFKKEYCGKQDHDYVESPIWIEGTNDTTEREPMKHQDLTQVKDPFLHHGDERH